YSLHDFAKNVYDVRASGADGSELATTRPDPYGWNVPAHGASVTVKYKVFGDRVDGTYLAVDETHAHINMPAAIMWAHGLDDRAAGRRDLRRVSRLRARLLHVSRRLPAVRERRRHGASQQHRDERVRDDCERPHRPARHGGARVLPLLERGAHPPEGARAIRFRSREPV